MYHPSQGPFSLDSSSDSIGTKCLTAARVGGRSGDTRPLIEVVRGRYVPTCREQAGRAEDRRETVLWMMDPAGHTDAKGEKELQGWLLLSPGAVPEAWRHRAVDLSLIPLLPEEATRVLAGDGAQPALDPEDATLARLLVRGDTIPAIARETGMSIRGVQRRLVRLRERFEADTTAKLRGLLADWGFRGS